MEDISTILLCVVGFFVVVNAFNGFRNGAARQVIKCVALALSAAVAYYITLSIYPEIEAMFAGQTLQEAIYTLGLDFDLSSIEGIGPILMAFDTALVEQIVALPIALIMLPLAFVAIFAAASVVMGIVSWLVCGLLGFSKRNNNTATRAGGALVGAVQGFLVVLIITVPLVGLVNLADTTYEVVKEDPDADESIASTVVDIYDLYVMPIKQSPVYQLVASCGGKDIYDDFALITVDGDTYDMNEEFKNVLRIGLKVPGIASANWKQLSDTDKANLLSLVETIDASDLSAEIVAGVFRGVSIGFEDSGLIVLPEPYSAFVYELVAVFSDSSSLNIADDLTTFLNVCFIVSDSGVLSSSDAANNVDLLVQKDANGKTLIDKVISELNGNDRTKHIVTGLTKLSLSLIQQQLGSSLGEDVNVEEVYNDIKDGFNGILEIDTTVTPPTITNEETGEEELNPEYVEEVQNVIDTALSNNNIELEEDVKQQMAEIVAGNHEKYEEMEELSDEEFNDMLLSYYDAYLKYLETGSMPEIPTP